MEYTRKEYHASNEGKHNHQVYDSTMEAKPKFVENVYMASRGFQAPMPEAQKKVKVVFHEYAEKDNRKFYEEEDVNDEAEEFIELKHKKFEMSKWTSTKY
ncbi:unnamed protein product [Ilex paraguariensis]|uniref:Uncharacterized protein n=1 Tax=Ilex paraguariensis TaxID=185542 RepID=A0ABC8UA52_9AQUA